MGFLNPLVYFTAATGFNDIIAGSNPGCRMSGYLVVKGCDPVGIMTPTLRYSTVSTAVLTVLVPR
jgi:tripeptidyl-peptidase I